MISPSRLSFNRFKIRILLSGTLSESGTVWIQTAKWRVKVENSPTLFAVLVVLGVRANRDVNLPPWSTRAGIVLKRELELSVPGIITDGETSRYISRIRQKLAEELTKMAQKHPELEWPKPPSAFAHWLIETKGGGYRINPLVEGIELDVRIPPPYEIRFFEDDQQAA